ncbi:MAG: DUF5615 family PIN-like protein [Deltaproteobacteria bacterium]|nr:DUF5615 family PIN-like protein [Deltaproteobacteria bacterium]
MKFKIDENLPTDAAQLLRAAGHDAVTVGDQALGGAVDQGVAEACRFEGRALVTLDLHFANIQVYPPAEYTGIVVLRLERQDKPHVLDVLTALLPALAAEPVDKHLWIVDEQRVRVRE